MKLLFLGTSNAFGADGRFYTSFLIEGKKKILVDAGPTLLSSLKMNNLSLNDIDILLLSHLHADHYLGIPQMVLENYYVIKREKPILFICPKGTKQLIVDLCNLIYDNIISEHVTKLFKFVEIDPGESYTSDDIRIETTYAEHDDSSRMLIIHMDNKIISYTGDTSFMADTLLKLAERSDILITECTSAGYKIPSHTQLEDLINLEFPSNAKVYLVHLGESTIAEKLKIKPPLYITEDRLIIKL